MRNTGLGSHNPLVMTFLSKNQDITLFYPSFCLKTFHLFIYETQREKQRHRPREKQAPRREPDEGLDPWTPGVMPWAQGRRSTAEPSRHPNLRELKRVKCGVKPDPWGGGQITNYFVSILFYFIILFLFYG